MYMYVCIYIYIYVYIYVCINRFSGKEKQIFWNLKFNAVLSTIFSQLTLTLNCYGILLTSLNLTCTKVKNTLQSCDDSAYQRMLQKPSTPQVRNWAGTCLYKYVYVYIYRSMYIETSKVSLK